MAGHRSNGQKLLNFSVDESEIEEFNAFLAKHHIHNRSDFIRQAINEKIERTTGRIGSGAFSGAPPRYAIPEPKPPGAPKVLDKFGNDFSYVPTVDESEVAMPKAGGAGAAKESGPSPEAGAPIARKSAPPPSTVKPSSPRRKPQDEAPK
jgi:hypothetical protein